jgi:hypothetical protein
MHDINGKTIFENGAIFEGEYKNDFMINGKFSNFNGDVYTGYFNKNNKMHGKGTLYISKSDEIFHGNYNYFLLVIFNIYSFSYIFFILYINR